MFPLWQKKEGPRHSPPKPMAMKGAAGDRLRDVAKAGREIFLSTCSPARETAAAQRGKGSTQSCAGTALRRGMGRLRVYSSESCPRHPGGNRDSVNALEGATFISWDQGLAACLDAA